FINEFGRTAAKSTKRKIKAQNKQIYKYLDQKKLGKLSTPSILLIYTQMWLLEGFRDEAPSSSSSRLLHERDFNDHFTLAAEIVDISAIIHHLPHFTNNLQCKMQILKISRNLLVKIYMSLIIFVFTIGHLALLPIKGKKHVDVIQGNTTICQFLALVINLHLA
ncbi:hypothetical protein H5410_028230, partial [Solanum commersonii]